MWKNTEEEKELPFFARFLEEQSAPDSDDPPPAPPAQDSDYPPFPWTFKYPSDLEDY